MNDTIRALLLSRKFIAALTGVLVGLAAKYGLKLDPETVGILVSPLVAYVVSQGMADKGKEAARIAAQAACVPAAEVADSTHEELREAAEGVG